jgi:hypothetical protein
LRSTGSKRSSQSIASPDLRKSRPGDPFQPLSRTSRLPVRRPTAFPLSRWRLIWTDGTKRLLV